MNIFERKSKRLHLFVFNTLSFDTKIIMYQASMIIFLNSKTIAVLKSFPYCDRKRVQHVGDTT